MVAELIPFQHRDLFIGIVLGASGFRAPDENTDTLHSAVRDDSTHPRLGKLCGIYCRSRWPSRAAGVLAISCQTRLGYTTLK